MFRSVGLPMIAPGFVTLFLFTFTSSWNNFVLPLYMLSDDKLYPVTSAWRSGVSPPSRTRSSTC